MSTFSFLTNSYNPINDNHSDLINLKFQPYEENLTILHNVCAVLFGNQYCGEIYRAAEGRKYVRWNVNADKMNHAGLERKQETEQKLHGFDFVIRKLQIAITEISTFKGQKSF